MPLYRVQVTYEYFALTSTPQEAAALATEAAKVEAEFGICGVMEDDGSGTWPNHAVVYGPDEDVTLGQARDRVLGPDYMTRAEWYMRGYKPHPMETYHIDDRGWRVYHVDQVIELT